MDLMFQMTDQKTLTLVRFVNFVIMEIYEYESGDMFLLLLGFKISYIIVDSESIKCA